VIHILLSYRYYRVTYREEESYRTYREGERESRIEYIERESHTNIELCRYGYYRVVTDKITIDIDILNTPSVPKIVLF
jgi:hypothetical protein